MYCTMYDPPFPHPVAALHAVKHGSRKGLARQILRIFQGGKTPKPDVYKLGGPRIQYMYNGRVQRFLDFSEEMENLETEPQLDYEDFHMIDIFCLFCRSLIV